MTGRNFNDPIYKDWRKKVFKRDGHACQMPGCKASRTRINAHHIKKWSSAPHLRFDEYNGITLCYQCHKDITKNEHIYESLFMDIVRANSDG